MDAATGLGIVAFLLAMLAVLMAATALSRQVGRDDVARQIGRLNAAMVRIDSLESRVGTLETIVSSHDRRFDDLKLAGLEIGDRLNDLAQLQGYFWNTDRPGPGWRSKVSRERELRNSSGLPLTGCARPRS